MALLNMNSPMTDQSEKRCPVCLKNLNVIKPKLIIERDGIMYCCSHCLVLSEKKSSDKFN